MIKSILGAATLPQKLLFGGIGIVLVAGILFAVKWRYDTNIIKKFRAKEQAALVEHAKKQSEAQNEVIKKVNGEDLDTLRKRLWLESGGDPDDFQSITRGVRDGSYSEAPVSAPTQDTGNETTHGVTDGRGGTSFGSEAQGTIQAPYEFLSPEEIKRLCDRCPTGTICSVDGDNVTCEILE